MKNVKTAKKVFFFFFFFIFAVFFTFFVVSIILNKDQVKVNLPGVIMVALVVASATYQVSMISAIRFGRRRF